MAKITRYNGNLRAFGADAVGSERSIFGNNDSPPLQSDDLTDNIDTSFLRGWGALALGNKPPREWFNSVHWASTQLSAYIHQIGVAEWNNSQEYHFASIANSNGVLYRSLVNDNVGNNPAVDDGSNWTPVAGLIVDSTEELIASSRNYQDGAIVEALGYYTAGDGGGAQWRKTGVTGLTASQTPVDLQKAKLTDAGGAEWELVYRELNPLQLGAKGTGLLADDDGPVLNLCLQVMREYLATRTDRDTNFTLDGAGRMYSTSVSLNCTDILGWNYSIQNFGIIGRCAGKIVFNAIGARGGTLRNFLVFGDEDNEPTIGIMFARSATAQQFAFCSGWTINNVSSQGYFSVVSFYAYGQETTEYTILRAWNSDPDGYAAALLGSDLLPINSDYAPPITGSTAYSSNGYGNLDVRNLPLNRTATITGITQAAQAAVTVSAPERFTIGDEVVLTLVRGMVEITNQVATVVNIVGSDIVIDIDSTGFSAYTEGGQLVITQNVPTLLLSRMVGHTFRTLYNVSYGQPNIEFRFPDGTPPKALTMDCHFEGAGAGANIYFDTAGAGPARVSGLDIRTFNANPLGAIIGSGAGTVDLTGGMLKVNSFALDIDAPAFDDESKYNLNDFDIRYPFTGPSHVDPEAFNTFVGRVYDIDTGEVAEYNVLSKATGDGSYAPNITAASGSITSFTVNEASFRTVSDLVFVKLNITIDDAGTGAGVLTVDLPTGAETSQVLHGLILTGVDSIVGQVAAAGDVLLRRYDGTSIIATGNNFILSGVYKKA